MKIVRMGLVMVFVSARMYMIWAGLRPKLAHGYAQAGEGVHFLEVPRDPARLFKLPVVAAGLSGEASWRLTQGGKQ
jgi:hypothetical protein